MGEAARRKAVGNYTFTGRSWATGRIEVVANDVPCFSWQGTRQDMADVMANYETTAAANGWPPESYAKRAAGYLMLYGMPAVGDADRRPSNHGQRWDQLNADAYRMAILWLTLRETVPDTGYPLVNMVVGKAVVVLFSGDRQGLLEDTWREMAGKPFSGDEFQMMVGISDPDLRLDPDKAVAMHERDLLTMAGKQVSANHPDDMIYVPRIPVDAAEADAILKMMTVFLDATRAAPGIDPKSLIRTYAGYTEEELRRDQPIVRIR